MPSQFEVDGLTLDTEAHVCSVGEARLDLTATEMRVLALLMAEPTKVQSKRALVEAIWGARSQVSDRTFDSHLRNLRKKLAAVGKGTLLETVRGVGIRLVPAP